MNTPNLKKLLSYALAYVMWLASFLLWVLFLFRSREAISGLLIRFYLNGAFQRQKVFQSFNQFYFYLGGLVWLVLMIVVEQYFRDGVKKGSLIRRISKIIGPELLLLFVADLLRKVSATFTVLDWVILAAELIIGAGLVWISIRMKEPARGTGMLPKASS
jgi:hypothetical protein